MNILKSLALSSVFISLPSLASALDITFGHTLALDSHYQVAAEKFKEVVEAGSDGELTVSIFPQSQLGGEVRMIQSARTGSIGAFITAAPPLENTLPEFGVFSLPYLFDSVDQANGVLQGPVGDMFLEKLSSAGMVGMNFFSVFERSVFGTSPVNSVQDMQGLKIRVLQGPGFIETYDALGAQSTPMAYSEVFVALQNGVVDGAEASPEQVVQDRFVEVIDNFSMTKIHYMPSMLVMSDVIFNQLTPEQQELVREASAQARDASLEAYKQTYADALVTLEESGVAINEPDLAEFQDAALALWPRLLEGIPDGEANLELIQEQL
ncbi:TRAP transporter substrate-binding protein [Pelagibacterium luteolum]|uniref:Tripartite ATP-independent transporter solute receptor, DctP family n=1 Tax=Pelagibacterium luteolum TaxID=440168 RepID=A0A1G7XIZ1_9HYPH|nr:TRAP transporter substrate-binding protein [Pelagibacterium luteolum]SDG84168.1 tripartite ATP-independent transporter solute receptor, DctP family [Pelagibacterium luteolum]